MKSSNRILQFASIALFVMLLCIRPSASLSESRGVSNERTQVVLLGTGNPAANPDRSGPSVAIVVNNTPYLVDFGPGVVRRTAAAVRKGVSGLAVSKLRVAFATHLHSDHTLGYADLIFSPWVLGRKEPLEVYGPKGIKAMTDHILEAYKEDVDIRINGLEKGNKTGYKVNVHEIKPGLIYKDENVTVKAFLVKHGSWPQAFGYRFETPDKVIVISGDSAPSQSVIENCNGCDILLHEAYTEKGFEESKADWRKYIRSFHTSSKELADLATKAKPALLVLYHQMFFGGEKDTEEGLLKEIQETYRGRVVSGHDLEIY